ncbi:hypothetical protein HP439_15325 [Sphingobacterium shayense]|uniref:MauE/DoxX family redox-associated membrane protein n=1 Tax=Sphingobacterium shayense TaxID=626343 RepID=UPI001557C076|nr:MauE/DoxX family redox-associated membrane protein [Sphingobacterium shayense]NQD72096.1 hypothetical protein [Sphingobacterium shayense]
MYTRIKSIALFCLQLFLMVFWIYVALDKLWTPQGFHRSLQTQPFPNWWADILFWLLPLVELAIGLLFVLPKYHSANSSGTKSTDRPNPKQLSLPSLYTIFKIRTRAFRFISPFLLSAVLLAVFSVYIGLGLLGMYEKRPCGCASVFSQLSWSSHLIVNLILLFVSLLGWFLHSSDNPTKKDDGPNKVMRDSTLVQIIVSATPILLFHFLIFKVSCFKKFPRRFALFTGRPVPHWPPYTFVIPSVKNVTEILMIVPFR